MVSGAIVAVTDSSAESSASVVWHQLDTRDPDTAAMNDSALVDWSFTEKVDLGQLRHHQRCAQPRSARQRATRVNCIVGPGSTSGLGVGDGRINRVMRSRSQSTAARHTEGDRDPLGAARDGLAGRSC
ncbi:MULTISPECIES: hypothetical protein [Sorangium]|uniref:hypothetical protein n=1 Tax=Sorangium TaxID=39643 RepID=UPI003D9C6288